MPQRVSEIYIPENRMTGAEPLKYAVTVIPCRPKKDGGFEICMTRSRQNETTPQAFYGFPGKCVTKEDYSDGILKRSWGLARQEARATLGSELRPAVALGHWVGAIRGLFERIGILLCVTELGEPLKLARSGENLAAKRRKLNAGEIDFRDLLESERWFCDMTRLGYFSRWLTPAETATPFDNRFFLAALAADQGQSSNSRNVADSLWIAPERALAKCQRGALTLDFTAYASLRILADLDSWESVCAEYEIR